ncbi:hypothetical protein SAMN05444377_10364 [Flavobacterium fontis]|uniref:Uncharacterized protein n=1 Tax=Flavobacterium fontis TaxID=1124188 RepID=A0A1M4YDR0_9FLAO|nr:hypothetical protein [Flavobacterium fontis]SHF03869.1 hypothetical protein SAMN05444377_10364 [Flavobacterium fontis]
MSKLNYLLLLLPIFGHSQISILNDTIIVKKYNHLDYEIVASDTIKSMYENQKRFLINSHVTNENSLSNKSKLNELNLLTIPCFRLKRSANEFYDCDKSIEQFIAFEDHVKYMFTFIMSNNKIINLQIIPNPIFEIERINNPDSQLEVNGFRYREMILNDFTDDSDFFKFIQDDILSIKNSFIFGIYGIWDVIFEIENGELFANKFGFNSFIRMNANDYLNHYLGEIKIKELARGYYEDIDNLGTLEPIPCQNHKNEKLKTFIKILNN